MEDYLRIIYELSKENKEVKSVDISRKLKVSKASVSEMLRKLEKNNLISIKPYSDIKKSLRSFRTSGCSEKRYLSDIKLTSKGREKAQVLYKKHDIIKRFMAKMLKDEKKAEDEAHKLEHSFSSDSTDILKEVIEGKRKIFEEPLSYIG